MKTHRIAVTGAGRGIGLATAKALHDEGATVIIGDLDESAAQAAATTIGPRAQAYALDVADYDSFARFIENAGPVDVLVNNAGIMPIGRFLDLPPAVHRKAVEVNVIGCLNGMHLALPGMLERGRGQIVNVASTAGKTPVPGGLSYCGTKSAVIALTETARVEYAGSGVEFTCVMPHFTNTELISGTSAMRFFPVVEPEDVADAIVNAIRKPKADVYVPKIVGAVLRTQRLMGRGVRDFVSRKLGAYNTFLDVDQSARAGYDSRIG